MSIILIAVLIAILVVALVIGGLLVAFMNQDKREQKKNESSQLLKGADSDAYSDQFIENIKRGL